MCVSGFEYLQGLDCYKCHCPFANLVERKRKMPVIRQVHWGPELLQGC